MAPLAPFGRSLWCAFGTSIIVGSAQPYSSAYPYILLYKEMECLRQELLSKYSYEYLTIYSYVYLLLLLVRFINFFVVVFILLMLFYSYV